MDWLGPTLDQWLASGRDYVLCGDWNIVRSALDIKNWKSNQKNSGCLPPERAWLNGRICDDGGSDGTAACVGGWVDAYRALNPERSEEHTSELQSLMRISYAVFCLKKKNKNKHKRHKRTNHDE